MLTKVSFPALLVICLASCLCCVAAARADEAVPQTVAELWADFAEHDRRTPLEAEILKTWEEDGVVLHSDNGVPRLRVSPDPKSSLPIRSVDIYYSYDRQPQVRFWADAGAEREGDIWEGRCPIFHADEPLFAFANVTYGI